MICVRCACGNCNRYERSSSSSAASSSLTDIYLHNSLCTHTKMKRKKGENRLSHIGSSPSVPTLCHRRQDQATEREKEKPQFSFFFSYSFPFANVFFSVTEIFSQLSSPSTVCLPCRRPTVLLIRLFLIVKFFGSFHIPLPHEAPCLSLSLFFSGSLWPRFRSKRRKKIRLVG